MSSVVMVVKITIVKIEDASFIKFAPFSIVFTTAVKRNFLGE